MFLYFPNFDGLNEVAEFSNSQSRTVISGVREKFLFVPVSVGSARIKVGERHALKMKMKEIQ